MFLIDFFLIWWLRSGRYRWSRLHRRLFERRYLATNLPEVNSLEEIQARLKDITWTRDWILELFDCISYPQRVWTKKQDDCDGFAILAAELLRRWSPATDPVLITAMVRPYSRCHTVCAFNYGDNLWYFDNSNLRSGNFTGYRDVVAQFTSSSKKLICWDVVNPDTLETLEFYTG